MGGNAFEDLEKLTPQEYYQITKELTQLIQPLCQHMEPYIPLPQKQIHGDVDFLILFKEGHQLKDIIELMKLSKEECIINNNLTANVVFKKKQIDFNITLSLEELLRCRFFKSYGGMGGFLGLLLPSKLVKFNEEGIFCHYYNGHHKIEFNVCQDITEILRFYGLSPQRYNAGFKTRKEVFDFLITTRFLDPTIFRTKKPKCKLINSFQQYLEKNENLTNPFYEPCEDPVSMTLKYFKKQKQFEVCWQTKIREVATKKERANKWNGKHIIDIFGVLSKNVNPIKKLFEDSFGEKKNYEEFVDNHTFEEIVQAFCKVCQIEPLKVQIQK